MFGKKKDLEEKKAQGSVDQKDDTLDAVEAVVQEGSDAENGSVLDEGDSDELQDQDELDEMAKKTKKKLPNWVIFVIIGAIILIAVGAQALAGGSKKKAVATTVKTYIVKTGDVQQMENASGLVDSENKKIVYSPVNAKVTVCNAKVGKLVNKGEKLVEFDTSKLEEDNQTSQMSLAQTQQANSEAYQAANKAAAEMVNAANEANQELADAANALADQVNTQAAVCNDAWAAYNNAKTNAESDETTKKVAEAAKELAKWVEASTGNYTQSYYELTSTIEKAKVELDKDPTNADKKAAHAKALKDKDDTDKRIKELQAIIAAPGSAVASALENAQAQDATYNDLNSQWQSAYNAAQSGTSVDTSSTAVKQSEQTAMEISSNAAELEAMTAAELVEAGRNGLSAEFDGVISDVQAAVGTDAAQGTPMFTLVDTSKMMVQIEVPTNDYAKYKTGQSATISIGDNTYKGKISNVNGMATTNDKGNQVIVVTVKLMNPDENIVIGASAKVSMIIAESKDTVYIPTEALNVSTDGDFVYVLKDGKVKETPVTIGISSDSKIEITKGLKKGDEVISDTSADLKDGMAATAEGE